MAKNEKPDEVNQVEAEDKAAKEVALKEKADAEAKAAKKVALKEKADAEAKAAEEAALKEKAAKEEALKEQAEKFMVNYKVDTVWYCPVKGYWFYKKELAQQYAKSSNQTLKTFTK